MAQAEALIREIAPHIKFLKNQAEKAEARGTLEAELERLERTYFAKILAEIEKEEAAIAKDARPFEKELEAVESSVKTIEREFGRVEGRAAAEREKFARPLFRITDANYVKEKISALISLLRERCGNASQAA